MSVQTTGKELFVWKYEDPEEPHMWCYAGGRRYLFADCIWMVQEDKYYAAIYDVDLDHITLNESIFNDEDRSYIRSLKGDFAIAEAIECCMDREICSRTTDVFDTEEEMWEAVRRIRE